MREVVVWVVGIGSAMALSILLSLRLVGWLDKREQRKTEQWEEGIDLHDLSEQIKEVETAREDILERKADLEQYIALFNAGLIGKDGVRQSLARLESATQHQRDRIGDRLSRGMPEERAVEGDAPAQHEGRAEATPVHVRNRNRVKPLRKRIEDV